MRVTKEEFYEANMRDYEETPTEGLGPLSEQEKKDARPFCDETYDWFGKMGWILVDRQKLEKKVQTWETMHPMEGNCPPLVAAVLKELLEG